MCVFASVSVPSTSCMYSKQHTVFAANFQIQQSCFWINNYSLSSTGLKYWQKTVESLQFMEIQCKNAPSQKQNQHL